MVVGDRGAHGDVLHGPLERRLGGDIEGSLQHAHRDLRTLGQLGGQRECTWQQFVRSTHLRHQPKRKRLLGIDDALAHEEVHGSGDPEVLHQQVVPAFVGKEAEAQRRAAELGLRRRDAEVARQGERQPGLDGEPVHRGNRELVEVAHGEVEGLREVTQPVVGAHCIVVASTDARHRRRVRPVIRLEVVTGDERSPRSSHDDDAHVVAHFGERKELDEVALEPLRHGVHSFGLVERDKRDAGVVGGDGEAGERLRPTHAQRPSNTGARFSRKARAASFESSVRPARTCRSASRSS